MPCNKCDKSFSKLLNLKNHIQVVHEGKKLFPCKLCDKSCLTNAFLKNGEKSLLRYGIEKSENQSFLGCFAYFYAWKQKLENVPTIEDMREILVDAMDIDMFIQYHNGNLVSIGGTDLDSQTLLDNLLITVIYNENNTTYKNVATAYIF